jgi:hypothetical protein
MTDRRIRIAFGIPAYGGKISMEHARMWFDVGHVVAASEHRFEVVMPPALVDTCGVDKARNVLMNEAVQVDAHWLLMVDADTWVKDGLALLEMVIAADRVDAAVAVAAVPRRHAGGRRELMVYDGPNGRDPVSIEALRARSAARGGGLVPVRSAATACMAVELRRAAPVLKGDLPWFRFTDEASEDVDFCERVQVLGEKVVVDPRVEAFHLNRPQVLSGFVD